MDLLIAQIAAEFFSAISSFDQGRYINISAGTL